MIWLKVTEANVLVWDPVGSEPLLTQAFTVLSRCSLTWNTIISRFYIGGGGFFRGKLDVFDLHGGAGCSEGSGADPAGSWVVLLLLCTETLQFKHKHEAAETISRFFS